MITYGSGPMLGRLSGFCASDVLIRVDSRCSLRFGRATPFVVGALPVGALVGCMDPGRRLAALEGEDDGGPPLLVAELVEILTLGFFVLVAVVVGLAIMRKRCHYNLTTLVLPSARLPADSISL